MSQNDLNLFVRACCINLQIETPVSIRFESKPRGYLKKVAALCESRYRKGVLSGFVITVNMGLCLDSDYLTTDVIAHELVHAHMMEFDTFKTKYHHNKRFQKLCAVLTTVLLDMGFEVKQLYSAKTDTD